MHTYTFCPYIITTVFVSGKSKINRGERALEIGSSVAFFWLIFFLISACCCPHPNWGGFLRAVERRKLACNRAWPTIALRPSCVVVRCEAHCCWCWRESTNIISRSTRWVLSRRDRWVGLHMREIDKVGLRLRGHMLSHPWSANQKGQTSRKVLSRASNKFFVFQTCERGRYLSRCIDLYSSWIVWRRASAWLPHRSNLWLWGSVLCSAGREPLCCGSAIFVPAHRCDAHGLTFFFCCWR